MKMTTRTFLPRLVLGASLLLLAASCSRMPPGAFKTPEDAVKAMDALIGKKDAKAVEAVFGPGSAEMFDSGDPVADDADYARVKAFIAEKVAFEDFDETTKIVVLGNEEWTFPVPLVKDGEYWRFDSAKGREEIANRRVGRNELLTMASLRAYVDAQREYFETPKDGLPAQYARRFWSSEGKRDGLYYPTAEGEEPSPLGEFFASGSAEGYEVNPDEPQAFHGYRYRILESQGAAAPGGARGYVDDAGHMTRGFACIAWPAKYGMSGIMTFQISDRGILFQKDLGEGTDAAAAAITAYDPDSSWEPTYDPDDVPETAAAAEGAEAATPAPAEPAPAGATGG